MRPGLYAAHIRRQKAADYRRRRRQAMAVLALILTHQARATER
jgi:hypothetical protein